MALSPTSSHGGGTFNGGTITRPLVLAMANVADVPLKITPPAGASAAYTYSVQLYDDAGHLRDWWDAGAESEAVVVAGSGVERVITRGALKLQEWSDANSRVGINLPAGWTLTVYDHSATKLMEVRDADQTVHLKNAVVVDL